MRFVKQGTFQTEVLFTDFLTVTTSVIFLTVMYEGQCRDVWEDGICALGERLFLTEAGGVECDCDEVKYKYQLFINH